MYKLLLILFFSLPNNVKSDINYKAYIEDELSDYPKCCALNSALTRVPSNSSMECSSEVLPLTHYEITSSKIISTGKEFSQYCVNTTCIDFVSDRDEWSLIKVADCKITQTYSDYNFYPKCCPNNYTYDSTKHNCVKQRTTGIWHDELQVFNISLAHCNRSTGIVDFHKNFALNEADKSVQVGEHVVEYPYYCLDTETNSERQILRACLPLEAVCASMKKRCIKKCCPDGEIYMHRRGRDACHPYYTAPFDVSNNPRFNKSRLTYAITFSHAGGKYVARDEHEFFVDAFGYFHTRLDAVWRIYAPGDAYYCAESRLRPRGGGVTPIVMLEFVESEIRALERRKFFVQGRILGVSALFMLATAACYASAPVLRNLHGRCVLMYCVFMGAAFATLSYVQSTSPNSNHAVCVLLGYLILFTILGGFAWMNVICFDMWMAFGSLKANHERKGMNLKKFVYYNLYAWGVPITICGLALIVFVTECLPKVFVPSIGVVSCYFDRRDVVGYMVYFLIPIASMQFANVVLFIKTSVYCFKVKNEIRRIQQETSRARTTKFIDDKKTFIVVLKLFIVMGIPWTFECVSHVISFHQTATALVVEAAMDYFNSMQGIIIFCILILKRRVLRSLKGRLGLGPVPTPFAATRAGARTSMPNSTRKRCPDQGHPNTGICKITNETEETES